MGLYRCLDYFLGSERPLAVRLGTWIQIGRFRGVPIDQQSWWSGCSGTAGDCCWFVQVGIVQVGIVQVGIVQVEIVQVGIVQVGLAS